MAAFAKVKFAMVNMIGYRVQVQTTSGQCFEGIFQSGSVVAGKEVGVVLGHAYKREGADPTDPFAGPAATANKETVLKQLVIKEDDVAQIAVVGIDLSFKAAPPENVDSFSDTGISGGYGAVRERKLEAWAPSEGDMELEAAMGAASATAKSQGMMWTPEEMFAKNTREHGYKSSYNELDYTTAINTDSPAYLERVRKANLMASNIIKSDKGNKTINPHILADRGIDVDISEAQLFSDVQANPNRYVPPSQRKPGSGPSPAKAPPGAGPPGLGGAGGGPPPGIGGKPNAWGAKPGGKPPPGIGGGNGGNGGNVKGGKGKAGRNEQTEKLKEFSSTFKLGPGSKDGKPATAAGGDKPAAAKPKALNPNAKTFSFNPGASSFTPKPPAPAPEVAQVLPMQQMPQIPQMRTMMTPNGPMQMPVYGMAMGMPGQPQMLTNAQGQRVMMMPNPQMQQMQQMQRVIPMQGQPGQPQMQMMPPPQMQQQMMYMQQQQQLQLQAQAQAATNGGGGPGRGPGGPGGPGGPTGGAPAAAK